MLTHGLGQWFSTSCSSLVCSWTFAGRNVLRKCYMIMVGTRPKKTEAKFLTVSYLHYNASLLTRSIRILTNAFCFHTEQGAFPYEHIIWKFYSDYNLRLIRVDKHTYALIKLYTWLESHSTGNTCFHILPNILSLIKSSMLWLRLSTLPICLLRIKL